MCPPFLVNVFLANKDFNLSSTGTGAYILHTHTMQF